MLFRNFIWFWFLQRDCPDGLLSKSKFLEVYSTFFPTGNPDKFCEHVFRSFDKDNSGKIDFKEFLLAINITSGGNPQDKLNWAFTMYDIDGNGTIEKKEMVEIIGVSIMCMAVKMVAVNPVILQGQTWITGFFTLDFGMCVDGSV